MGGCGQNVIKILSLVAFGSIPWWYKCSKHTVPKNIPIGEWKQCEFAEANSHLEVDALEVTNNIN